MRKIFREGDHEPIQTAVSTQGGEEPLWSPAGGEMFYRSAEGRLVGVPVNTDRGSAVGTPSVVVDDVYFDGPGVLWGRMYDVSPDGQRFLVIRAANVQTESSGERMIVQNWAQELLDRVPTP